MPLRVKNRIGIFGGTFNPVHLGHLIIAQGAMEARELGKVFFVPASIPPHKRAPGLLPARHRVAMLEAAIEADPRFEMSTLELERNGPSYTVDTLEQFRELHPAAELHFIIGSDTLLELHTWKQVYRVLELATIVTFVRPGFEPRTLTPDRLKLDAPWPEKLLAGVTACHLVELSSSEIRYRVAESMSIRYLVPAAVEMYISEHHLYGK